MAITYTNATPPVQSPSLQVEGMKAQVVQLVATGTYATGGNVLTAAQLGINSLASIQAIFSGAVADSSGASTGIVALFNTATNALQFYGGAAAGVPLAEITAGTTLTGLKVNLFVIAGN